MGPGADFLAACWLYSAGFRTLANHSLVFLVGAGVKNGASTLGAVEKISVEQI